jgi:hypothetical protein
MLGSAVVASGKSRLAWTSALASATLAAIQFTGTGPAAAQPAKPATDASYYVLSTSTTTAYTLGCDQGQYDASNGDADSEVFLDFGGQTHARTGTELITGTVISNATVESLAEQFASGYYECTGSDSSSVLNLAIGTNNSLYSVDTGGGKTWAGVVNAVASWVDGNTAQVAVWGGDDIEPSWSSPSAAINWSNGFGDNTSSLYLNYGSADGCPETTADNGACNNGWDQGDVYYIAWGSPSAVTAPEIYYAVQASQWAEISLYGYDTQQRGAAQYQGPLTETDLASGTLTPAQAYDDLWTDLSANSGTAQNPPFSLQVDNECSPCSGVSQQNPAADPVPAGSALAAYPQAKLARVRFVQAQVASEASRHSGEKSYQAGLAAARAANRTAPARRAAITALREGPFPASSFGAQDLYQGPARGTWVLAYAGAFTNPVTGAAGPGGVLLYAQPQPGGPLTFLGAFAAPGGTGPLKVTAVGGDLLTLAAGHGATITFDLATGSYRG